MAESLEERRSGWWLSSKGGRARIMRGNDCMCESNLDYSVAVSHAAYALFLVVGISSEGLSDETKAGLKLELHSLARREDSD